MKAVFVLVVGVLVLVACNKDKFETKPTIEIKSTSGDVVPRNSDFRVTLTVTDKEGDVDDSLYVIRERLNRRAAAPRTRTLPYKIPTFPDKSKVEFEIILDNSTALTLSSPAITIPGQTGQFEPDTLSLKFVAVDKAKNKSDTVSRNVIVIR